jgi:hypothetical protein
VQHKTPAVNDLGESSQTIVQPFDGNGDPEIVTKDAFLMWVKVNEWARYSQICSGVNC